MFTKEKRYKKFTEKMEAAGLEVEHYEGRNLYKGPAVRVDDLEVVLSIKGSIHVQWDNMGKGWIVYPV